MTTKQEYIQAETQLIENNEKLVIYSAALERELYSIKAVFGDDNIIAKAISWVTEQAKKWTPLFDVLLEFVREMRPLVIVGNQIVLPSKWKALKWLKIGWAAGKLIVKIVKLLTK